MPLTWPSKDPDEVLDYQVDWERRLDSDTIASSTWEIPNGIGSTEDSFTDTTATVWLTGGTLGRTYQVMNRIVTNGGRTMDQTINIRIRRR